MPNRTSGCHMHELQFYNPRKRRHSERSLPQQNKCPQHISKKQKRIHPSGSQFPSTFWDNLSTIDLTTRALKELNQRNTRAALNSRRSSSQSRRPITRRLLTELKNSSPPLIPADCYIRHCGTIALKNIKKTAKHGGPDLSDLRGVPEPSNPLNRVMSSTRSNSRVSKRGSMSSSSTRPSATTTTTRTTGPYNRNFQQHLIDNGVYPPTYRYPNGQVPAQPDNWEEINQRLTQPRPSLLPSRFSKEEHQEFVQADADAAKEKQVSTSVIPIIERYVGDAKCVSGGIRFTNLDDLTDGTLAPGNPDVYHGARPEQLDRRVRDELSGQIIPSTQDDLPIIPNFFLAAKGPDGSAAVARRQACYDGALGTRGMQSLQSYRQEGAVFDNNAYTITSTYQDGQLKIYTSHPLQSSISGTRPQYCMNLLRSFAMTDTVDTFRQGATAYRNARDWAKEQRENTIREANQRASDSQVETLGIDAKSNRISSRGSEITVEESPRLSQESRNLLNETSSTATDLQASSGSQRKRQNTGESDYDLLQQPELDLLEPSGSSQQLGYQTLEQEQDSQLNDLDSQPLTPNTSKRAKR